MNSSQENQIEEGQRSIKEIFEKCKFFQIPIYQRNYSWEEVNCKTLLKDIEEDSEHFTGSIVLQWDEGRYCIIDGQQRLTTITILMIAIRDRLEEVGQKEVAKDVASKYLIDEGNSRIFRMSGGDKNREWICDKIRGNSGDKKGLKAFENYEFFKNELKELNDQKVDKIYQNLCHLKLVVILLDEKQEPQKIFESLNSTGVKLRESDLIRNFIFMRMDNKQHPEMMEYCWKPIEKNIKEENLDIFFRHFLTFKAAKEGKKVKEVRGNKEHEFDISKLISESKIYENFKHIYIENTKNPHNWQNSLMDLKEHSALYSYILGNKNVDEGKENEFIRIVAKIRDINFLGQKPIYPLLLYILQESKEHPKKENYLEALKLLERYIFRCIIANSKELKQLGADVVKIIKFSSEKSEKKLGLIESINKVLKGKDPKDEDMGLLDENFYNKYSSKVIFYLFARIDNEDLNIEPTKIEDRHITKSGKQGFTVEHIFPKKEKEKWSDDEKKEYGDYWEGLYKSRHSIGNLIITDRNYDCGDKALKDKLEIYKTKAVMTKENKKYIESIDATKYSAAIIKDRSEQISKLFVKLWPKVPSESEV